MELPFRLVSVFAVEGDPFSGNPLAVVEDAGDVAPEVMQAVARQFNLSETTFVTAVDAGSGTATVRIFTTTYEMPFAGHPTLGTAHVVAGGLGRRDVVLDLPAGHVPVVGDGDTWTLTTARASTWRTPDATRDELAATLGLDPADLGADPLLVDSGVEQLVVPLASVDAVRRMSADATLLHRHVRTTLGEPQVLAWAEAGDGEVEARFVLADGGSVVEDPATGSACANLGGWFVAHDAHRDAGAAGLRRVVHQGAAVQRPSLLRLGVSAEGVVTVGGLVIECGSGTLLLP